MSVKITLLASVALCALASSSIASADDGVEFRINSDVFSRDQSDLEGTIGLSVVKRFNSGFYWGTTVYSASKGSAGGFFVGGIEAGRTFELSDRFYLDANMFVGGGGGATQVPGDGLMLRPRVAIGHRFENFALSAGASWVKITGSNISTPSYELSISTPLNLAVESGHKKQANSGFENPLRLASVRGVTKYFQTQNSLTRSGSRYLDNIYAVGMEMTLSRRADFEYFLQVVGAVGGDAEGYADWNLGLRKRFNLGPVKAFGDVSFGVGGGGDVNVGGGLLVSANAGLNLPIGKAVSLEASYGYIQAVSGDFKAYTPTLKLGVDLGSGDKKPKSTESARRWQYSVGVTHIDENSKLRKNRFDSGSPTGLSFEFDYFTSEKFYLTMQAFTAFRGNAGGFQYGVFGVGYEMPIADRWRLSAEGGVGTGGGAGIETRGGLVAAANMDLDYLLNESTALTLGGGWLKSVKSGGVSSPTLKAGLKFKFTTFN